MTVKIWEIDKNKVREVNKILEAPEIKNAEGEISINEFARNGYQMRDGNILQFDESKNYLYISADDEFFSRNKDKLKMEGVKELTGDNYEKIKKKIEDEEKETLVGIGSVFKGF